MLKNLTDESLGIYFDENYKATLSLITCFEFEQNQERKGLNKLCYDLQSKGIDYVWNHYAGGDRSKPDEGWLAVELAPEKGIPLTFGILSIGTGVFSLIYSSGVAATTISVWNRHYINVFAYSKLGCFF